MVISVYEKRNSIIKNAIMEKLGQGFNVFTADDILTVAGVDEEQLSKIAEIINKEVANITEQIPAFDYPKKQKGG